MSDSLTAQLELEATADLLRELARRSRSMVFSGMTPDGAKAGIGHGGPEGENSTGIQVAICGDTLAVLSLASSLIPQIGFQMKKTAGRAAADCFVARAFLEAATLWDQLRTEEGDGPVIEAFNELLD